MDNTKLPPIPTPASQRWREFRIQVLPFVMFLLVIVAIVFLWRAYVQPIGVIGFAETNQVNVTSVSDGLIDHLYVEAFQTVTQGQVVAMVSGTSTDLYRAQIASFQAELEVQRDRLRVDQLRAMQNVYDSYQNILNQRILQATAQQDWILRSNDYRRAREEFTNKTQRTISEADFEKIQTGFNSLTTQIRERENAITNLAATLDIMRQQNADQQTRSIDEALKRKAEELEVMLKPSYLKAPIDGMVSMVHRRQGEKILRGDSVATIVDTQARRVIGYIRQPINFIPSTNTIVKILKRTAPSLAGEGRVERVGAQFEFINPALLAADTKRLEVGLPILVSVPPGFQLVPGEYVTLTIDYSH
jgi:multidrug resistance efflux pump